MHINSKLALLVAVYSLSSSLLRADITERVRESWEDEYLHIAFQLDRYTKLKDDYHQRLENETYDPQACIMPEDSDPLDVVIRRTEALIADLSNKGVGGLNSYSENLASIKSEAQGMSNEDDRRAKYREVRVIQREVAFKNPLLTADTLLFNRFWIPNAQNSSHMVNQYLKCRNLSPARICYLLNPWSDNPSVVDVLENSVVENGKWEGEKLGDCAIQPDVSFDGNKIAFSYDLNLFTVNRDGSGLRQITESGSDGDWDPCWLPGDERLVFVSLRRGGSGRCHTKPTFCMYGCKSDGSDLIPISYHETNEWHPSINNDGMIVYCRWDYVDRDSDIAHHIWICGPDGTDPRAPHGNYPHPYHTLDVDVPWYERPNAGRGTRPWMEMNIRAIPETEKYVATAAPHHGRAFGSLVIIDPTVPDDGNMSQLKRLNPLDPFPESETEKRATIWGTPYPLSEDYFVCSHDPRFTQYRYSREKDGRVGVPDEHKDNPIKHNLYLLDRFGNIQLLWAFDDSVSSIDPIPLESRESPPIVPTKTFQGERSGMDEHYRATISINNVYEADMPWPEDYDIKWMRIVQLFPCPSSVSTPSSGPYGANTRMSLGIVPVEDDGSVYCEAPIEKAIYFQLLDENKMAVHSMRSDAFVHPGENLSCIGCHEDRLKTPVPTTNKAMKRAPSRPEPEAIGLEPISFPRHIRPILESNNCVGCHKDKNASGPQYLVYDSIAGYRKSDLKEPGYLFFFHGSGNGHIGKDMVGGSRTIPGYFGSNYSRMGKKLLEPEHRERLTEEDFSKIMTWIDCNSMQYGTYTKDDQAKEEAGELVWPKYDATPGNVQGIELDRPINGDPVKYADRKLAAASNLSASRISITMNGITVENADGLLKNIRVFDARGSLVERYKSTDAAAYRSHVPFNKLRPGAYIISVRLRTGERISRKFTILQSSVIN